jgi:hypothetical protein
MATTMAADRGRLRQLLSDADNQIIQFVATQSKPQDVAKLMQFMSVDKVGQLLDQIPTVLVDETIENLTQDIQISDREITTMIHRIEGATAKSSPEVTPMCVKALDIIGQLFGNWENKSIQ